MNETQRLSYLAYCASFVLTVCLLHYWKYSLNSFASCDEWVHYVLPNNTAGSTRRQTLSSRKEVSKGEEVPSRSPPLFSSQEQSGERFSYPSSVVPANMSRVIDFFSPDYYDQMLLIRKGIAARQSVVPSLVHQLHLSSPNRTDGIVTDTHAILTNVCMDKEWTIHLFNNNDIVNASLSKYNGVDFYYNRVVVHPSNFNASLPQGSIHDMIVTHTRSNNNIFHILESQGLLVKLALHPELFPTIHHLVMASFSSKSEWWNMLNNITFDLFEPSRRPTIVNPFRHHGIRNLYCDSSITLLRTWDARGSGVFIGEKLGVDMLRAAAYHYANVRPQRERTQLHVMAMQRKGKRKIANFQELTDGLRSMGKETELREVSLEEWTPKKQIGLFADTDVIVAPHGAGLTNVLFMLPRSGIVELFPPNFVFFCYQRMCKSVDVMYSYLKGVPATPPPCMNKNQCIFKTKRDVDFTVFVNQTVEATRAMLQLVKERKYGSCLVCCDSTLCWYCV